MKTESTAILKLPRHGTMEIKVYYEDTDSLGVVYYANYLKYFERGRTELVNASGRGIEKWNAAGLNFAVYKVNVTYLAPARLGDICQVVTRVLPSRSSYRLVMEQELVLDDKVITEAEVHLVCLDEELKLRDFPSAMLPSFDTGDDLSD